MSSMIKIWSDGKPVNTRIAVVDESGKETPLIAVQSVEYSLTSRDGGLTPGQLRLGFCAGSIVELEMPATGDVIDRLRDVDASERFRLESGDGASQEFTVGDVVQIKSGGPKMTVELVGSHGVRCAWFRDASIQMLTVPAAALVRYGDPVATGLPGPGERAR